MAICVLVPMLLGIHLGRGVANLLAGAGWTWPATDTGRFPSPMGGTFWTSLPGVITGHADAGLTPAPAALAGPTLLWGSILVTEAILLAAVIWAIAAVYQRWGPGRMRGMASAAEAEKLLGVTRLRKVAPVVRPDRYGRHAPENGPVYREAGEDPAANPSTPLGRGLSPWLLDRGDSPHSTGRRSGVRLSKETTR